MGGHLPQKMVPVKVKFFCLALLILGSEIGLCCTKLQARSTLKYSGYQKHYKDSAYLPVCVDLSVLLAVVEFSSGLE